MHFSRSRRHLALIMMLGIFPLIISCSSSRNGVIHHKRKGCDCPKWSHAEPGRNLPGEQASLFTPNFPDTRHVAVL